MSRSQYFNTALDTDVGNKDNSIEVQGCLFHILTAVVDFMYGLDIDLDSLHNLKDLESLLAAESLDVVGSDRSS